MTYPNHIDHVACDVLLVCFNSICFLSDRMMSITNDDMFYSFNKFCKLQKNLVVLKASPLNFM